MNMLDPLARAKGHGSAKEGTDHWWHQRLSSLLLIPLTVWLVLAIFHLVRADHATASAFIANPIHAAFALVLVVTVFYHTKLGLQVIVEDYVHLPWLEVSLQLLIKLFALTGSMVGVIAIFKVAFGG